MCSAISYPSQTVSICAKAVIPYKAEGSLRPDPGSDGKLDLPGLQKLVHATIDFTAYKDFKLDPVKDVELPAEGSLDLSEFVLYAMAIDGDWRMRQGGSAQCRWRVQGRFLQLHIELS